MIISLVGNIGAGKTTLSEKAAEILKERGVTARSFAIENFRVEVWRGSGRDYDWRHEDKAYEALESRVRIESTEGNVSFMETTGLARRMWRIHRYMEDHPKGFGVVKVSCPEDLCIQRELERDKNLDEFPLPFEKTGTTAEAIRSMAPKVEDLEANLVLDSRRPVEENAERLANWIQERLNG